MVVIDGNQAVLSASLMKSFVFVILCYVCMIGRISCNWLGIWEYFSKMTKNRCDTQWLAPFRPLYCTYIFSSYIFQSDFTFCLPLFSVHHHSLFLIAFNFPSQLNDDNDNNDVLKNDLSHMMWLCCQRHTHTWKMIIAFGLWILAYFCNKQNFTLLTTCMPSRFSIHFVSEHICRWQHHIRHVKCALSWELWQTMLYAKKEPQKLIFFCVIQLVNVECSKKLFLNENWVTFENYFQVTFYVTEHRTGLSYKFNIL